MGSLFDTLSPEGSPIYLADLPNKKGPDVFHQYVRGEDELQRFIATHDKDGRALYFTVAKLKDGTSRSKENVESVSQIWTEVDFKDHPSLTPEEIRNRIEAMPHPPTTIVASGHGFHLYWKLNEPADATPGKAQQGIEDALKLACAYAGGDANAAEAARLLRLPGSHNTKFGDNILVSVLVDSERRYELSDLVDFWLEAQPILPEPVKANGRDHSNFEFTASSGPVDVEARLRGMRWQGPADSAVHITQLQCTAALLRQGVPLLDVTAQVLEATCEAVAGDPRCADWDWRQEERAIERLSIDLINKDHSLAPCLPDELWEKFQAVIAAGNTPKVSRNAAGLHVREYKAAEDEDAERGTADDNTGGKSDQKKRREHPPAIEAVPFKPFDPAQLAAREWLYDGHYQRHIPTATVGTGGGGKSSLDLVELIAMCTGRNLLGEQPLERCKAWYHNAEDPLIEIYRRIAAVCQHYEIPQSELQGWLFVTSGIEMPIKIAASHGGKLKIDGAATGAIIRTITDNDISVTCFDPLIAHHTAAENITGDMDQVIREFARVADITNCAIEIVHHTRKPAPGQEELSVADSRGAGAIKDAVRSMRVLNTMSKAEADSLGIDDVDRRLHFRVDNGKANMSPPSAAQWRKFVSVSLPNGDNVGVVTEWAYPQAKVMDVPDAICVTIQAEVQKGEYRAASQSPNWVGKLIARTFRLDTNTKQGKTAVGRLLEALFNKGVITTAGGETGGHKVTVIVPGAWRPAS